VTGACYVEQKNWLVFFLANYNFLTMDLADFNQIDYYRIDNIEKIQVGYMQNPITRAIPMEMGETAKYLLMTERGDTLITDFLGQSVIDFRLNLKIRLLTSGK
jgi:hypothetical protein